MGNVSTAAAAPQNLACGCWWAPCNRSHAFNPLCVLVYLDHGIPVWQPPVSGHQHQAQCLYFTPASEQCSAQQRPHRLLLSSAHNFPQTYHNSLFWFDYLKSSVCPDKHTETLKVKDWASQVCVRNVLWVIPSFALSEVKLSIPTCKRLCL